MEVDAQHLFRTNGIDFDAQVFLPGIGRVDFLLAGFLIVEIDGFAFHSQRADMLRDRDRNNTSTVKGFAVLRYMPEHIWFNPDHVLGEIRAVLAARSIGQGTSNACVPARLVRAGAARNPASPPAPARAYGREPRPRKAGNKPGRNARNGRGKEKRDGSGYRLAAGTSTQRTSTDSSVGLTQVCGSRPGKVTVSPVLSSYSSLVRISRMRPLITWSTSTSQSTA